MSQVTSDMFKGYYIPTPLTDTYFCMQTQELVSFKVHNFEDNEDSREAGEIYIFDPIDDGYTYINHEKDYFWYDGDEENLETFDEIQKHFTNDKFRSILNYLYNELLAGKQMVNTMYDMMFLQRFSYISKYEFNF